MKKKPPFSTLTPEERRKRLRASILAGLGKVWIFWQPRLAAKTRCRINDRNNPHHGWYVCEQCHQHRERIEVDHIIPCIRPADGFTSWDAYIDARFVEDASQLQALCHECHQTKSKSENAERRRVKKCASSVLKEKGSQE